MKISRLVLAFAAIAAVLPLASPPASAANLALTTKAPRLNPLQGYLQGQCGAFLGLNTFGTAQSLQGGPVGAQVVQGDIGGTIGYGCPLNIGPTPTPGSFWFVEGNFDWANLNGQSNGLGLTGPAHFEQRVALGSPLSSILNLLPNNPFGNLSTPSVPLCPVNVVCGNQYPFLFASLHEQDIGAQLGFSNNKQWLVYPGAGVGLESRWSNGLVVDVWAEFTLESSGMALGPDRSVKLGNGAIAGTTFKF